MNVFWRLTPGDDRWEVLLPMIGPRWGHRMVAHDGRLYVVGGRRRSGRVLIYAPGKDWKTGAELLLGILPPLIYSAGVATSWREFRFNLRPIALLAFGCVGFTLLGMPLAVGFVLGAIVAPPDVVVLLAIVCRLGVPRRLVVVLEAEGLINDATALILYALIELATGKRFA